MEMVLDVYKRPLDLRYPVVCMDESPKQLISETKVPIPVSIGRPARYDYEYKRCGVCNIFLACEPLAGKRLLTVTESKTKQGSIRHLRVDMTLEDESDVKNMGRRIDSRFWYLSGRCCLKYNVTH